MSIGRICAREVHLVDPEESVRAAARRMRERNVGTLVVAGPGGLPIGLVTDRDLALRVVAEGRDADATPVRAVMTEHPRTLREDASIEAALAAMTAGGFRRVLVLDDAGELAGIVSLDDVLALLAEELGLVAKILAREEPRSTA
jgi:CBS domain-containing protein